MHNKTFRLFISSTFSDFSREREYMQTQVFPAVEAICTSFGYQFQAIDLRRGVNEEQKDNGKVIFRFVGVSENSGDIRSLLLSIIREADDAFSQSINYAHQCNNIVGEWITKCVMKRIGFIGGLSTIDDFNNTLDEAFKVFKSLESTNHAAKRWVMNIMHHKFEVGFIRNDLKMIKYHFEFIRTNEWNLEHNVPMDLFEAQIAMRDKDYEKAIGAYNSWLEKLQQKDIRKTEAFADIYFQLGIVYDNKGDSLLAKQFLQEALSLDDEPANHIPKQKARDYLDKITCY